VFFLGPEEGLTLMTYALYDPDHVIARYGRRLVSDADGRVFLPGPPAEGLITAEKDGRWGFLSEDDAREPEPRVALHDDPLLDVKVVGPDGRPVEGIPVVLRTRGVEEQEFDGWSVFPAVTFPGTGIARLRHLSFLLEGVDENARLLVALYAVLEPPVEAALDWRDPFAPVRLALPPTGSVEIELKTPEGRLWTRPFVVTLGARSRESRVVQWARGGRAFFEHVGLGLTLEGEVDPETEFEPEEVRRDGPRVAGERVVLNVTLSRRTE
jgi:hypothetical protein